MDSIGCDLPVAYELHIASEQNSQGLPCQEVPGSAARDGLFCLTIVMNSLRWPQIPTTYPAMIHDPLPLTYPRWDAPHKCIQTLCVYFKKLTWAKRKQTAIAKHLKVVFGAKNGHSMMMFLMRAPVHGCFWLFKCGSAPRLRSMMSHRHLECGVAK